MAHLCAALIKRPVDDAAVLLFASSMHSEALVDQDRCVDLYAALGDAEQLRYAREHRDVIKKFERFPHRNRALDRSTTQAEREFLNGDGVAG